MPLTLGLIAAALVVLVIVGLQILAELRRGRAAGEAKRGASSVTVVPRVATFNDESDGDITLVGPSGVLPQLSSSADGKDDEKTPSTAVTLFEAGAEEEEPTGSRSLFLVYSSGQTDCGQKRKNNEDSILLMKEEALFVVADGMGGYAGGEVASKLAVDTIEKAFRLGTGAGQPDTLRKRSARATELVRAIEAANTAIREEGRRRPELAEMGSTLVGARFLVNNARAIIGYIGDSRCYRFRNGQLRQLTTDHTLAAKGVGGAMGGHLRRALGIADRIAVDMCIDRPEANDVYLLCSDGLNKMIDDSEIAKVLESNSGDLDRAVEGLISEANQHGGRDNVSVVLVGVRSFVQTAA